MPGKANQPNWSISGKASLTGTTSAEVSYPN